MSRARDRVVDVIVVTVAAAFGLLAIGEALTIKTVTGAHLALSVVSTVVCCAALLWRRRWPIGVALLQLPPAMITDFAGVAELVAVYTVAAYRSRKVAVAVAALHFLAAVQYTMWGPIPPDLPPLVSNVLALAFLSIALAWGMVAQSRREVIASLRERATKAEAEAALQAERQRLLERERIAREMHDVLAHRISLVSLHAGALETRPDLSTEEVARTAGTIRASAHQALEDLREILGMLRAEEGTADLRPQPVWRT